MAAANPILYSRSIENSTVEAVGARLEEAVKANKFGIIHVVDMQARMKEKNLEFDTPMRIYEVCNPGIAKKVLDTQLSIAAALPCRVSVFAAHGSGTVTVETILPSMMLGMFNVPELQPVADDVEKTIKIMIDAATTSA